MNESDKSGPGSTPTARPAAGTEARPTSMSADTEARPTGRSGRGWRTALRVAAVLVALAGWWLSMDLLRISGGARATIAWLDRECGASGSDLDGGCLSVLRSELAMIRGTAAGGDDSHSAGGVPWAAMGAGYFSLIALWYLLVGVPTQSRWWAHLLIMVVVGVGVTVSLHLTQVMASELQQWCVGCVGVHVLNGHLAVITLLAFPWTRDGPGVRPAPGGTLVVATLLCGFLSIQLHVLFAQASMLGGVVNRTSAAYLEIINDPRFALWKLGQQEIVSLPPREGMLIDGSAEAAHTVVVFSDFQCPRCAQLYRLLAELTEKLPQRLRVVHRHYPLDRRCNAHATSVVHPQACLAARAMEAAGLLGGEPAQRAMRAALYENQRGLSRATVERVAGEIGLDPAGLMERIASAEVEARLRADVDAAAAAGVKSAPAVFVDGRRLEYWTRAETWAALLEGE